MSVHILFGKPGSGKSMYGTKKVIDELAYGSRNVVTNLPLRPDRLNEYLNKRFPHINCRMVERLRIMTDEEMAKFWIYRGPGDAEDASTGYLALGSAPFGVAYFLDEAHIAFNARDWATIGRGALHYLSQHRKLGDVVFPITQSPGNLDKQFRSIAEDFTQLRNEYVVKLGPFRGRGRFVRKSYYQEPQQNSQPFEVASFELDKEGIASCYDTAKGIGVHGNKADIGRRAKGIPILWTIPIGMAICSLIIVIPWLMSKATAKAVQSSIPVQAEKVEKPTPIEAVMQSLRPRDGPSAVSVVNNPAASVQPQLFVKGVVRMGSRINVLLSDGRTLTELDPQLARVDRSGATLSDGTKLPFQPIVPRGTGIQNTDTKEKSPPNPFAGNDLPKPENIVEEKASIPPPEV